MDALYSTSGTPRERRAEIRAALVKHAPALVDRYDAAVRLVEDKAFPWRTRLVGHAVREMANALPAELLGLKAGRDSDSILDDVAGAWDQLAPSSVVRVPDSPRDAPQMPSAGAAVPPEIYTQLDSYFRARAQSTRRRDAAEALFAWSDPFNRAQLASLGPVLKKWLDATRWFVRVTHAPRRSGRNEDVVVTTDGELAERFAEFERALLGLLGGFFSVQADIEAIATDRGPAALAEILPLLAGAEQRRQFLDRLDDPAWIEPLEREGFFARPEEPLASAEVTTHPVWPALRYLRRMAARAEAQEEVARIVADLPDTDNVTIHRDLVEIALVLPPHLSRPLALKARGWLGKPRPYGPARELAMFAGRLSEAGHSEEALGLWDALLEFTRRPPREHDGFVWPPDVEARVAPPTLRGLVVQYLPALVKVRGRDVIVLLGQRLSEVLKAGRRVDDEAHEDYLGIWLSDLGNASTPDASLEVVLVCALRDAAIQAVDEGQLALSEVVAIVEARPWRVFKRLAMHLLERSVDQDAVEVGRYLADRRLLEQFDAEYQRLLHRAFRVLVPEQGQRILRWIEEGPEAHQEGGSGAATDLDHEDRRALDHWRWQRFGMVASDLPDALLLEWSRLRGAFGEPPPPGAATVRATFGDSIAFKSPLDADTLRALPVAEQVERIRAWRPSAEAPFVTYQALRETISGLVADDPSRYAAVARLFAGLQPTLVRGLIGGLAAACEAKRSFPWEPVLDLGRWIVAQPVEETAALGFGEYPGWAGTRSALASLLSRAFGARTGAAAFPGALRHSAAELVAALMASPPAGKEQALKTLIDYAMWVRSGAPTSQRLTADLPEVDRLLTAELGPNAAPEAYRAMGGLLPWLLHLDPEWVAMRRDELFPTGREGHWREMWAGFMGSHEAQPHRSYAILHAEYARAVEDLARGEDGRKRDLDECLAGHLLVLYVWGDIGLDGADPLLARFFHVARAPLRKHLLWQVAQEMENILKLGSHVIDRLKALWADRLAKAEAEELAAFGWWFASGQFDEVWALEQLEAVLRRNVTPASAPEIVERLADLAPAQPRTAARLLNFLTAAPDAGLVAVLWLDDARRILAEAVRSGDGEAYAEAMAARDRLGKAGFAEARQILPLSQDLDDPQAIPYFLWDEPMTVSQFRARLAQASEPERLRLLAKLLREARDTDAWKFTTPDEVGHLFPQLVERLGRKRDFWESLLKKWREQGLLARP